LLTKNRATIGPHVARRASARSILINWLENTLFFKGRDPAFLPGCGDCHAQAANNRP